MSDEEFFELVARVEDKCPADFGTCSKNSMSDILKYIGLKHSEMVVRPYRREPDKVLALVMDVLQKRAVYYETPEDYPFVLDNDRCVKLTLQTEFVNMFRLFLMFLCASFPEKMHTGIDMTALRMFGEDPSKASPTSKLVKNTVLIRLEIFDLFLQGASLRTLAEFATTVYYQTYDLVTSGRYRAIRRVGQEVYPEDRIVEIYSGLQQIC